MHMARLGLTIHHFTHDATALNRPDCRVDAASANSVVICTEIADHSLSWVLDLVINCDELLSARCWRLPPRAIARLLLLGNVAIDLLQLDEQLLLDCPARVCVIRPLLHHLQHLADDLLHLLIVGCLTGWHHHLWRRPQLSTHRRVVCSRRRTLRVIADGRRHLLQLRQFVHEDLIDANDEFDLRLDLLELRQDVFILLGQRSDLLLLAGELGSQQALFVFGLLRVKSLPLLRVFEDDIDRLVAGSVPLHPGDGNLRVHSRLHP